MSYKICKSGLPHSAESYFDWRSSGFERTDKKQKLLDIGCLLSFGYDVRADIHELYDEREYHHIVPQHVVRTTLFKLIAELHGGYEESVENRCRYMTTDAIIDELFDSLRRYYHRPVDTSIPHYLKDPMFADEDDIRKTNGWLEVVEKFEGNDALYDRSGKEYIYPGDEPFVHKFNERHSKEKQFALNTLPCPWQGNPLGAKVIILSQNPGWSESSRRIIPAMMQRIPQIADEVMEYYRCIFSLKTYCGSGSSFLPPKQENPSFGFDARDAFKVFQNMYWNKRIAQVVENVGDEELVYDGLALIQYLPYSSTTFTPLGKDIILPSQEFTRRLIRYIRYNHSDTIFVVLRAVDMWKEFLGYDWTALEEEERIITHLPGTYRSQYISPNVVGEENFYRIVNHLKEDKR